MHVSSEFILLGAYVMSAVYHTHMLLGSAHVLQEVVRTRELNKLNHRRSKVSLARREEIGGSMAKWGA